MSNTTFETLEPQPYTVNLTLEVLCDSRNIQRTTGKLARFIDAAANDDGELEN